MKKKWICTVCGYVHEGDEAPDFCPQCKQPKSKFKELVETTGALTFADEHVIGVAKGCDDEMIKDLNAHFMGECTEVGTLGRRGLGYEDKPRKAYERGSRCLRRQETHCHSC